MSSSISKQSILDDPTMCGTSISLLKIIAWKMSTVLVMISLCDYSMISMVTKILCDVDMILVVTKILYDFDMISIVAKVYVIFI